MNMTDISQRQNEQGNINKLQAQRQTYSDIKFWMILIFIVGVVFPVIVSFVTFIFNNDFFSNLLGFEKKDIGYFSAFVGIISTVLVGIISIFIKKMKEDAAKIQEMFDTNIFQLPWDSINIGNRPDTGFVLKQSKKFKEKYPNYTGFSDWYTIKAATFKYPEAIAFCQQQNLHWDSSLRICVMKLSILTLIIIILIMLTLGISNDLSMRNFFTNVVLLLFPVCLFFYKMIREHYETIKEMERLRGRNEDLIDSTISTDLNMDDFMLKCRQLQTAIYTHRKSARPIPNWLHKRRKDDQEEESADRMQQYLDEHR